jgi:hypothetical protein
MPKDGTYQPRVYRSQGGDNLIVHSSGSAEIDGGYIDIRSRRGGKIRGTSSTASSEVPAQAAAFEAFSTADVAAGSTTGMTKFEAIRIALINVGILAST